MVLDQTYILGVDGGGTKTEAWLARVILDVSDGNHATGDVIGRGLAGSSNVKAVGASAALTNLNEAIQAAWSETGCTSIPCAVAVLGLSGAGRPDTQALVETWVLENQIANRVRVVHDALPVLAAGTQKGAGVALIAGTGAVAFAANNKDLHAVVGGWGYWFGDEGSAFWLGQAAARAVSHAADGRAEPTLLSQAVMERLGVSESREILSALGQGGDVRSGLAGLAGLVTACAEKGDETARHIVHEGAAHLAALVVTAAQKVHLSNAFELALAGGVIAGSSLMRDALGEELAARMITPTSIQVVENPVVGCLRLAQREMQDLATDEHGLNTD